MDVIDLLTILQPHLQSDTIHQQEGMNDSDSQST